MNYRYVYCNMPHSISYITVWSVTNNIKARIDSPLVSEGYIRPLLAIVACQNVSVDPRESRLNILSCSRPQYSWCTGLRHSLFRISLASPDPCSALQGVWRRQTSSDVVSAQTTRVWCHAIQPLGCINYYITYYVITVYAYTTTMYTPFETLFKCYNK